MTSDRKRAFSVFALIGLLLLSMRVYAIDETYYIPYTNHNGYQYDPQTGQYVKTQQSAPKASNNTQKQSGSDTEMQSDSGMQNDSTQTAGEGRKSSAREIPFYIKAIIGVGSGILIIVVVLSLWLRQRKRNAILSG